MEKREFHKVQPFKSLLILVITAVALFQACSQGTFYPSGPTAVDGMIDLGSRDFQKDGPVALNGEWKYRMMEDDPGFASPDKDDSAWDDITLPAYWDSKKHGAEGYGWFRLRVKVNESFWKSEPALYLQGANTAYELYVNGERVMGAGKAGADAASSFPNLRPEIRHLPGNSATGEMVIAVKVANYFHRGGGLNKPLVIGPGRHIGDDLWARDFAIVLVLGFILMMCFYHIILWLGRSRDLTSLWFSIFCLAIFLHSLAIGNFLERMFPLANVFETRFKIEYMSLAGAWMSCSMFLYHLFPREFTRPFVLLLQAAGIILGGIALVFSARFFTRLVSFYNIVILVGVFWSIAAIILACVRRREDSGLIFAGWAVIITTVINDILHNHGVIHTFFMSEFGLGAFILFQSSVLSLRFSRAFRTADHLSKNLNDEVKNITGELRLQTEKAVKAKNETEETYRVLSALYENMSREVLLARSVHDRIIPKHIESPEGMKIIVDCRPYMEIGGDLYDVSGLASDTTRVLLADATGHGISASFVTMLIKSEYDKAKEACDSPGKVFERLNAFFFENYKTLRMFFTGVIIDINRVSRTLTFASAGHPEQFLMRGERIIDLERTGRAVGISVTSRYETISLEYSRGDKLYLFTDGIFEEFDENREEFGADRLKKYIQANVALDAAGMVEAVMKMMTGYVRGGQANDDMTMIGIELE